MGGDNYVILGDGSRMSMKELDERVTMVAPGVIKVAELAHANRQSLTAIGEIIETKVAQLDRWALLMDLTEAQRPDADYRAFAVQWTKAQTCKHVVYIQPHGVLLRVALRFIAARTGIHCTIHATEAEAVTKALTALAEDKADSARHDSHAPKSFRPRYEEAPASHPSP